jgi:hypothetical protein
MGWNSWNWHGKKDITEAIVRETIDAMVSTGLRDAGYRYVVVDGGWRDTKLGPKGKERTGAAARERDVAGPPAGAQRSCCSHPYRPGVGRPGLSSSWNPIFMKTSRILLALVFAVLPVARSAAARPVPAS